MEGHLGHRGTEQRPRLRPLDHAHPSSTPRPSAHGRLGETGHGGVGTTGLLLPTREMAGEDAVPDAGSEDGTLGLPGATLCSGGPRPTRICGTPQGSGHKGPSWQVSPAFPDESCPDPYLQDPAVLGHLFPPTLGPTALGQLTASAQARLATGGDVLVLGQPGLLRDLQPGHTESHRPPYGQRAAGPVPTWGCSLVAQAFLRTPLPAPAPSWRELPGRFLGQPRGTAESWGQHPKPCLF